MDDTRKEYPYYDDEQKLLRRGFYQLNEDRDAALPQVEPGEEYRADDQRGDLIEAMTAIIGWIIAANGIQGYAVRLLVLCLHLDIGPKHLKSYADVARMTGDSRQAVQFNGKALETKFGLRWNGSRTDTTRRKNARCARRRHHASK